MLSGYIDDNTTSLVVAQFLFLESENNFSDIKLYINSPGGVVTSGLGIYDTMQYLSNIIKTICIGQACSMGSFILASGAKDNRYALENSRIMIHQPIGGYSGQASDIAIHAQEIINIKKILSKILSYHTGQSIKTISKDVERDYFMSSKQAINYGIIDKLINKINSL